MKARIWLAIAGLSWVAAALPAATEETATNDLKYVGVDGCRDCHKKKSKGAQYQAWTQDPHAQAWVTLGTPEAAAVAERANVTGDPREAPQCLECHVTGAGEPADLTGKIDAKNGVGCESCHGAGEKYANRKAMEAIFHGDLDPFRVGLTFPSEDVCLRCHNDRSPTFAGFDYDTAAEKIAHPQPESLEATRRPRDARQAPQSLDWDDE
ncbi:MAG: cytochrome c family protein [bacterium]